MPKQISITLEQTIHTHTVQHHKRLGEGFTSEEVEGATEYEIIKMTNAVLLDWKGKQKLRVSSVLTEQEAEDLARCPTFMVTIIR